MLAQSTIKKAVRLVEQDLIQDLGNGSYLVQGSKQDIYTVTRTEDGFKCECKGFILKARSGDPDCYHCEAVRRIEEKKN